MLGILVDFALYSSENFFGLSKHVLCISIMICLVDMNIYTEAKMSLSMFSMFCIKHDD